MAPNPFYCAARSPGLAVLPTVSAVIGVITAAGTVLSALLT
jgi:hypothetical protein